MVSYSAANRCVPEIKKTKSNENHIFKCKYLFLNNLWVSKSNTEVFFLKFILLFF